MPLVWRGGRCQGCTASAAALAVLDTGRAFKHLAIRAIKADTWEELRANVREAVTAFYFDRPAPRRLRLHLVRDEVIG